MLKVCQQGTASKFLEQNSFFFYSRMFTCQNAELQYQVHHQQCCLHYKIVIKQSLQDSVLNN